MACLAPATASTYPPQRGGRYFGCLAMNSSSCHMAVVSRGGSRKRGRSGGGAGHAWSGPFSMVDSLERVLSLLHRSWHRVSAPSTRRGWQPSLTPSQVGDRRSAQVDQACDSRSGSRGGGETYLQETMGPARCISQIETSLADEVDHGSPGGQEAGHGPPGPVRPESRDMDAESQTCALRRGHRRCPPWESLLRSSRLVGEQASSIPHERRLVFL